MTKTKDSYKDFYPKPRSGKECRKTSCIRHKDYLQWLPGNPNLSFCMNCKWSHVSQYKPIPLGDL